MSSTDRAAAARCILLTNRLCDVFRCEVECTQAFRIDIHAHFIVWCTNDCDAGDAFDLFKSSRVYIRSGARETAQISTGDGIGAQREYGDRSLARIAREQRWAFGALGETPPCRIESFAHREYGTAHVGAPTKARRGRDFTIATD